MQRPTVWLTAAVLLATTAVFAQGNAYIRGADGKWRTIPAQVKSGKVALTLKPADLVGGRALVVVSKPSWMVLADDKPPTIRSIKLGGVPVALVGGAANITVPGPATLTIGVADDLNPVDGPGIRLALQPPAPGTKIDAKSLQPPAKAGSFSVQIPELPAGLYEGTLTVPDMSPQENATVLSLRVCVPGLSVSADKQSIRAATVGGGFTLSAAPTGFLRIGEDGQPLYMTSEIVGEYCYVRQITGVEPLPPTPGKRAYRITAVPGSSEGQPVKVKAALEFDVEIRPELPCLFVRGRAINQEKDSDLYSFWGWPGGKGFDTDKGHSEWKMAYADIGQVKWVFLPPDAPGKPGMGIISPLNFGESRFGTLLMYTVPQKVPTKVGGGVQTPPAVETPFAIMPAQSAAEVRAVAEKIGGKW